MTYNIIKNIIPSDVITYLQNYTLQIKQRIKEHEGKPKSNGSGVYWKGLDMIIKL